MNTISLIKQATAELKEANDLADLKAMMTADVDALIKARKEASINPNVWQQGLNDEHQAQAQLSSMIGKV
jgi:FtsZ-binding cell division protein ZapB